MLPVEPGNDNMDYLNTKESTERRTDTHTHTQTHTQTHTDTHRHTDTQTHRHTDTDTHNPSSYFFGGHNFLAGFGATHNLRFFSNDFVYKLH